jgi:hypothetical protein
MACLVKVASIEFERGEVGQRSHSREKLQRGNLERSRLPGSWTAQLFEASIAGWSAVKHVL